MKFFGLILAVALLLVVVSSPSPTVAQDSVTTDQAAQHESADHTDNNPAHGEDHGADSAGHGGADLGRELPLWSAIPFLGILLSIALFPLFAPGFWHRHFPKVSAMWAILFAVPFVIAYRGHAIHEILHIYLLDYIPFIILLWSLYTVSAGILVKGTMKGSPQLNVLFLIIGTAMASWIGTTGASMVLIRPVLRANNWRKAKAHIVVFFIFLVSNIGGSLTPLGDPPLFLGFLHNVPFFWTFNLILPMLTVTVPLLVVFFFIDTYYYRKETQPESMASEPVKVEGLHNLIFLVGIISAVLMSGLVKIGTFSLAGIEMKTEFVLRDMIMVVMGFLSLRTTSELIHKNNQFSWFPIKEVAYLFAGIFMTIIPALAILKAGEAGALGFLIRACHSPARYFWITGGLSSFLDNAPTYLTFFNTALGSFFSGVPEVEAVPGLIAHQSTYLLAISSGAVFMGAMTYIGNAPNFMVRSIAEEAGVSMPSFFGYLFKYSAILLLPIFVMATLIFFR